MQQDEKIEGALDYTDSNYKYYRRRLIGTMQFVMENLQREIFSMKRDEEYCPNPLGVVQGAGASIDTDCAAVTRLLEEKKTLKRLLTYSKWERHQFQKGDQVEFFYATHVLVCEFHKKLDGGLILKGTEEESQRSFFIQIRWQDIVSVASQK